MARSSAVLVVVALLGSVVVSDVVVGVASADADGDGLPNEVEVLGWTTADGTTYVTDPEKADTDGDGLTDGDEAGAATDGAAWYVGYSNPLVPDSDGDELFDAQEADGGLDPWNPDGDDDGLTDGREVNVVGTSATTADSDDDGFDDGFEEEHRDSKGLDPLIVDVEVSKLSYATDFAIGSIFGDTWRKDSVAWLAGYLAASGSSSLPVIGWVVGPAADVRDAVASAIRGDWVGSGFSVVGAVPVAGDAVSIPAKAAAFVSRNSELATVVAATVVAMSKVPKNIKVQAVKQMFKHWDELNEAGAGEEALLRLVEGRTDIDALAEAWGAPTHVDGAVGRFFDDMSAGESWLATLYDIDTTATDQRARFSTGDCEGCNTSGIRMVDVVSSGVGHEAKVGYVQLSDEIERQIRSDAFLVEIGALDAAHWHFMASAYSNKMGADAEVFELLDELGIAYTIHLPA